MEEKNNIVVYTAKNGAIELREDLHSETVWASQSQIADIFGVGRTVITKHIGNIFKDKELDKKVVCANFAHTTQHGAITGKVQTKQVEHYNLDIILAVGYRVKSSTATKFRQWATKTLREHITKGYTINKKVLAKNYDEFLQAVESVRKLLPKGGQVKAEDVLELVKMFAGTWLSLDAYDKSDLPKIGATKKQVAITAEEISEAVAKLKQDLVGRKEATDIFAKERNTGNLAGIIGNVFQSFGGQELYASLEEKSAHLLYFIVKNHPFVDGNKRSGAFAFVWFLNKAKLLNPAKISPEALTALTLLVAESNPKDKEQIIGLILLLLKK